MSCIAGEFGGLAVCIQTAKLKNFFTHCNNMCMVILYRTTKFKSHQCVSMAILGSTAKFIFPANISCVHVLASYPGIPMCIERAGENQEPSYPVCIECVGYEAMHVSLLL